MSPSLRALLTGIIDYAGLFPPANLPLDEAVRNYARYRTEPESWMLARFVCPANRLPELGPHLEKITRGGKPLSLSVLGVDGKSNEAFQKGLIYAFVALQSLQDKYGERIHVDAVESRVSLALFPDGKSTVATRLLLQLATEKIDSALALPLPATFFEVESGPDWLAAVSSLMHLLSEDPLRRQGIKVRCGGLDAKAVPPTEQVAFAIIACCDAGIPLKFTAGLHHPIRHYDAGFQAKMHGFLNVFGAGVLAHARNLNQEQVEKIIEDEDARNFFFEDDGFRWQDWRASVEEIAAARRQLVTSFGSCSFDEPREDLRALGLLP